MDLRAIAEAGEAAMASGQLWQQPPAEEDVSADPPPLATAGAMRAARPEVDAMRAPRDPE